MEGTSFCKELMMLYNQGSLSWAVKRRGSEFWLRPSQQSQELAQAVRVEVISHSWNLDLSGFISQPLPLSPLALWLSYFDYVECKLFFLAAFAQKSSKTLYFWFPTSLDQINEFWKPSSPVAANRNISPDLQKFLDQLRLKHFIFCDVLQRKMAKHENVCWVLFYGL